MKRSLLEYPKPSKIASIANLRAVWFSSPDSGNSRTAAGIDDVTPHRYGAELLTNLEALRSRLVSKTFQFSKLRPFTIKKKGTDNYRVLCIPTVEDRLVQRLIGNQLVANDKLKIENKVSYGFIKGKSTGKAIKRARNLRKEFPVALKTDIQKFFDRIDRDDLINKFESALRKTSIVPFVAQAICCELQIDDDDDRKIIEGLGIMEGIGLRQGMPLSPLLSNFVLREFDRFAIRNKIHMVRYVDDIIALCQSEQEAIENFKKIQDQLGSIGHTVPELGEGSKTEICEPDQPVEFLGFEIEKRKDGNGYQCIIPGWAFQSAEEKITSRSTFSHAKKRYKRIDRYLSSIHAIANGYQTAYRDGKNYGEFQSFVDQCIKNSIKQQLGEIFGEDILERIDVDKRKYLGLNI